MTAINCLSLQPLTSAALFWHSTAHMPQAWQAAALTSMHLSASLYDLAP
jgi:hypothetical protein